METKKIRPIYSSEMSGRAVRMVFEQAREHASQWAAIVSIAAKIGCTAQMLRNWVYKDGNHLTVAAAGADQAAVV